MAAIKEERLFKIAKSFSIPAAAGKTIISPIQLSETISDQNDGYYIQAMLSR